MFNQLKTVINLIALCLILGLCAWLWHQSNIISSLKAENLTQAQTIQQQQKVNEELTNHLTQERQATEQQKQVEIELRSKLKAEQLNVKEILVKEPCAHTDMPSPIIDSIKRLYR